MVVVLIITVADTCADFIWCQSLYPIPISIVYRSDTLLLIRSRDCSVSVNDVIADKNVVNKIMNNSTGLQRIELNGFAKRHWQTGSYPFAYGWCLGLC